MRLLALCERLGASPLSQVIRDTLWVIPTVQTVHILGIAALFASVALLGARLLGVAGTAHSVSDTARRFLPWTWLGLALLIVTGSILFLEDPAALYKNVGFRAKMLMLIGAIFLTAMFQISLRRHVGYWQSARPAVHLQAMTAVALLLWCGVIVAGRWIAYLTYWA